LWTLVPRLQRSWRNPRAPFGQAWSCRVADVTVGDVRLSGVLHVPDGAREAVVLVHGLGGNAESDYLRVAAGAAARSGVASLRLSLRGADGLGEDYYHAGLTEDLAAALASPELEAFERLYLLGYSLGGHVALRLAATAGAARLAAVAAVCSPLDLRRTSEIIDRRLVAAPYRIYLLAALKRIYAAVAARRSVPAPVERVQRIRRMREWDDVVVAPRFGFANALDYYARMSVGPLLGALRVPTLMISSMHDPMVPAEAVAPWLARVPEALTVRWVDEGGHLGFPDGTDLGLALPGGGRSFESQLLTWLRRK